ncbi:response regulator [Ramlibacter sp. PS4R-6]|uniref:response regulator n=1 Tax=Ramlibacter sp. PS4R-6 TaxID=3133438 RepID=UPI0030B2E165
MAQRVFVNVVGFTDEERHALNLLFRMSEEHATAFALWQPQAPEPARVALIDGESYEARVELELPRNAEIPVLWVGPQAPFKAFRKFARPIQWPEIIRALDELYPFDPTDSGFDIDLEQLDTLPPDSGYSDTVPPDTQPPEVEKPRRALIACASLDERLYLRAKLALAGLTIADEAETAPQALELVRDRDYVLAIVDLGLGGLRGWDFLKELSRGTHPIPKVIVTASRPTFGERMRARSAGVAAFLAKPPDPVRLQELLAQA